MQAFQNAAAAFCIACICAEVTALLTGTGWAGRCIKAVAGLYILVVLFRLAPGVKPELKSAMEAVPSSVHIQSAEISILQKAQERLESSLRTECMQRFGVPIELDITLTQEGQTVQAGSADFTIRMYRRRKAAGRRISAGSTRHSIGTGDAGGSRMKETEGFSIRLFAEKCKGKQGRARLAAAVGLLAMLLLLLSELFPQTSAAGSTQKAKSAQSSTEYQAQLEERLERLISHMSGAGKTTVMVTLGTGEEMIYALDTQSGDMQSQQTHVLLEDGSALTETVCVPQVCGVAVLCEGGGDVRIAARITELVSALLDLPSNHICVEQRKG